MGQIRGNREENKKWMKRFACMSYLDLSSRMDADMTLLIGDRKNNEDAEHEVNADNIYETLCNIFYVNYAWNIFRIGEGNEYHNALDYLSMAKCVAFGVVNFLWIKDKGYKIRCCINKNDRSAHFDDILRLKSTRKYQIARVREFAKYDSLDSVWYCDICLCRQGDYGWMYRCQWNREHKYNGHDICVMCIYNMIKSYNQLHGFLQDLLSDKIPVDCVQTVVIYTVGDVVKL